MFRPVNTLINACIGILRILRIKNDCKSTSGTRKKIKIGINRHGSVLIV